MPENASPRKTADTSLEAVRAALGAHAEKTLALVYADGGEVRSGYHVTEVKAGSFVTLDCGGNPDSWRETVLQVEDLPATSGKAAMRVGKFLSILASVDIHVPLDAQARLTIEVSRPNEAMGVYDVAGIEIDGGQATLWLAARPAICKPRHRAVMSTPAACCGPVGASCCA